MIVCSLFGVLSCLLFGLQGLGEAEGYLSLFACLSATFLLLQVVKHELAQVAGTPFLDKVQCCKISIWDAAFAQETSLLGELVQ